MYEPEEQEQSDEGYCCIEEYETKILEKGLNQTWRKSNGETWNKPD
jgi:hypothetical protein